MLETLTEPWREVLLLGWEAYDAGTIPVGAVVTDEAGAIASRGRNRIFDEPHDGQLSGSRLAHAEINALLHLPADRRYEGWTLCTLLEPCHLCLGAAHAVRIGTVRYAAHDPWGGAHGRLFAGEDHLAHPLAVEGPLDDELGRLGELLLVAHFLWRVPDSNVSRFFRRTRADLVEAATTLPPPRSGARLADVAGSL
jgi:tRNA(Arg) A34 adenosine deaminase TadA